MNIQPAVVLIGPISTAGSQIGQFDFSLYNSDSFSIEATTDTKRESFPGFSDKESQLTPIAGERSARVDGETGFNVMSKEFTGVSRKQAVRKYIAGIEALCLPSQGAGWIVEDRVRGKTYDPNDGRGFLVEGVTWEHEASEPERISWDVEFKWADGVQGGSSAEEYFNTRPMQDGLTDGIEVGGERIDFDVVEKRSISRSVDIKSNDLLYQQQESGNGGGGGGGGGGGEEQSPVIGTIDSGLETDLDVSGKIVAENDFEQKVRLFDEGLHGETADLYDEISGRVWTGTVADSTTEINAGEPATRFDFSLTFEVGNVVTDSEQN